MAKQETGAAKAATIKPFTLTIEGEKATFHAAGGKPIEVKLTDEIKAEAVRLGLGTALQNKYADSKTKGWDTPAAKGEQAAKLAQHWADTGTWSMDRAAGGVSREAMAAKLLAELQAKIDAMDVPAEMKALLKAQLAA
jgi:hypothetical protein